MMPRSVSYRLEQPQRKVKSHRKAAGKNKEAPTQEEPLTPEQEAQLHELAEIIVEYYREWKEAGGALPSRENKNRTRQDD